MRLRFLFSAIWPLVLILGGTGCGPPAPASGEGPDFTGRTVRIIVPYSPGGGFDNYARLLSRHFGRYLPGNPTVVIENLPGAGGLLAARRFARRARPDGLTLALLPSGLVLREITTLGAEPPIHGGFASLPAVGAPSDDLSICVLARGLDVVDLESWARAAVPPRIGMTGPGSGTYTTSLIVSRALGLPIRPVMGYQGTADIKQAIDSGEIDGTCTTDATFDGTFGDPSNYFVVVKTGPTRPGRFTEVPVALDLATGPTARTLIEVLNVTRTMGRFYVLPAGTPSTIVETMRAAFERAMRDERLLAEGASMRLPIHVRTGAEVAASMAELLGLPRDTRVRLARALDPATLRPTPGAPR